MARHRFELIAPTQEMQIWTGEEDPALAPIEWGTYTALGPFVPERRTMRGTVYARRVEHAARHHVKLRKGQITKWATSAWREAGEFLVGAFQPIRDAV